MGPSDVPSKICFSCARRKLAGKPPEACADCALLNVDHLAQVRANAARPMPRVFAEAMRQASQDSML